MQPPSRAATVITDASFCPETNAAAWAAWIRVDGVVGAIKGAGKLQVCTDSTLAEVMAAANGCWLAARHGVSHILLQSDCMAVIHLVDGASKAERLLAVWKQLLEYDTLRGVQITARHVKGHGKIHNPRTWVNDWCDRSAYEEMRKARAESRGKAGQGHRPQCAGSRGTAKGQNPFGRIGPRP